MVDQLSKTQTQKSWLLFLSLLAIAILYLAFPSYRYFADSLDYAWTMETGSGWIVHPHHPLFPFLAHAVYRILGGLESGISGLDILLYWSVAAGIVSCIGMVLILRNSGLAIPTVLLSLGLFAFSRGVWYFSVTPNQHSTGLMLNVLTLLAIVYALKGSAAGISRGQTIIIGILTGLAVHTTKLNIGLVLPAAYVILSNNIPFRKRITNMVWYIVTTMVVGGILLILLGTIFSGLNSAADFINWQQSYVMKARWWPDNFMDAIQRNWVGLVGLHLSSVFNADGLFGERVADFGSPEWFKWIFIKIGQALVLLFLAIELIRTFVEWYRNRSLWRLQTLGLVAALPAFLFSIVYTPEWPNIRILYLPGILLFLAPALERHYDLDKLSFRRSWPILLVVVSLFAVNFTSKVLFESGPDNNPYLYEATSLQETLDEGDLFICSGTDEGFLRGLYTRYSTRCEYIQSNELVRLIRLDEDEVVDNFKGRLENGHTILVHEDSMSGEDIEFLNARDGTDIGVEELRLFFERHLEMRGYFVINEKKFIFIGLEE